MPWSSGTFSRTDSTYNGSTVWAQNKAANVKIIAESHDSHDQDLASGINNCLTKDGQNSPTSNIDFDGNKITNLGSGSSDGDVVNFGQVKNGSVFSGQEKTVRAALDFTKGADVASASALSLGDDGNYFNVTGTTTVTSISTWNVGDRAILQFDGALTLTHHATNLILPGGANITTAAGDHAEFVEYASGQWRCLWYSRAGNIPFDYEEGTWTPTLVGSSTPGSPTYSTQSGKYTKIGDIVFCQFRLKITAGGSIAGNLSLGGLPLTSSAYIGAAFVPWRSVMSLSSGEDVTGTINASSTSIQLQRLTSTSVGTITDANIDTSDFEIRGFAIYSV